jgi:hypothetical protein
MKVNGLKVPDSRSGRFITEQKPLGGYLIKGLDPMRIRNSCRESNPTSSHFTEIQRFLSAWWTQHVTSVTYRTEKNIWLALVRMQNYEHFRTRFGWVWWQDDESPLSVFP